MNEKSIYYPLLINDIYLKIEKSIFENILVFDPRLPIMQILENWNFSIPKKSPKTIWKTSKWYTKSNINPRASREQWSKTHRWHGWPKKIVWYWNYKKT